MNKTPADPSPLTLDETGAMAAVDQLESEAQPRQGSHAVARKEKPMKITAGLWIDHRKAVIVRISSEGEETKEIQSHVEKQPGRLEGVRSTAHYEAHQVPADDSRERDFTNHLNRYYAEVIEVIRDVVSVLIFGPGEAKGELRRRLEHDGPTKQIIAFETTDKMTDHQIAAKVREHFHQKIHQPK